MKAGAQVYLGNDIGLSISFAAGSLTQNHTATTTVSHTPTDVDPTATFNNANTNLRPRFDNNAQITAGSFTINGTSITVNANDTINLSPTARNLSNVNSNITIWGGVGLNSVNLFDDNNTAPITISVARSGDNRHRH